MALKTNPGENYSPLYFLGALGNGGLAVTFYMFLHFMVPHEGRPMATFDTILPLLGGADLLPTVAVSLALLGILVFAFRHYRMLIWNLGEYGRFKETPAFAALKETNGGITVSAVPLTLAMSVNVFFIIGAVFVPGLWNIVEWLFPGALLAFVLIGIYAVRVFMDFFAMKLAGGGFDCAKNNSLGQMIAVFAFTMVGVGAAAPGAMSHNLVTSALGIIVSLFFYSASIIFGLMILFLGFRSMLEHGVDRQNSASLWIVVPIMTLLGIAYVRLSHGLHVNFEVHTTAGESFVVLFGFLSIQLVFGLLGYFVMKRVDYFAEFVWGEGRNPGAYALICPESRSSSSGCSSCTWDWWRPGSWRRSRSPISSSSRCSSRCRRRRSARCSCSTASS